MKPTSITADQIILKVKTADQLIAQDKTMADISRVIMISHPYYHRWCLQCVGLQAEEAKRLTQLEKEDARVGGPHRPMYHGPSASLQCSI